MKLRLLFFAFISCICGSANAQITIGTADLPSAGDTFRLSVAAPLTGADYTLTGANYTWDFTLLQPVSQQVDTFLPLSSTSSIYTVLFSDFFLNPYRSNQATKGTDFSLLNISVSGVYNFYYNSSASYRQSGFGASVNGVPAPVGYDPKDLIYEFPLNYLDVDTSYSSYTVDLTSTVGLYFKVNRTRVNDVDGWGTLITPYGTHSVLRVKTSITEQDSVYYSVIGTGLNLPPITNIEYKWLASGEGVPLLQANATSNGQVTQVLYRDDAIFNVGVASVDHESELVVYPNPTEGRISIAGLHATSASADIEVFDLAGKKIAGINTNVKSGEIRELDLRAYGVSQGNYLLRVNDGLGYFVRPVSVK